MFWKFLKHDRTNQKNSGRGGGSIILLLHVSRERRSAESSNEGPCGPQISWAWWRRWRYSAGWCGNSFDWCSGPAIGQRCNATWPYLIILYTWLTWLLFGAAVTTVIHSWPTWLQFYCCLVVAVRNGVQSDAWVAKTICRDRGGTS